MTLNANTGLRLGNIGTGHMCVLTPTQQPSRSFGTDLFFAGHRLWVRRQKSLTMYILVNLWFSWCFTIIQVPGSSFCSVGVDSCYCEQKRCTMMQYPVMWHGVAIRVTEQQQQTKKVVGRRQQCGSFVWLGKHPTDHQLLYTSCYDRPATYDGRCHVGRRRRKSASSMRSDNVAVGGQPHRARRLGYKK